MIRQHLVAKGQANPRFRWRGLNVSRLENLMDVAFAFALGTIVFTSEMPRSFAELVWSFRELPAFLACFAIIVMFWFFHYWHHRRYGLDDTLSTILDFVLLFLILGYVIPLKFLFTALFGGLWSGRFGVIERFGAEPQAMFESGAEVQAAMLVYAGGFAAIFLVFALLTLQAYRHRDALELDAIEVLETRETIEGHVLTGGYAALLAILAALSELGAMITGPAFALLGLWHWLHGRRCHRRRVGLGLSRRGEKPEPGE